MKFDESSSYLKCAMKMPKVCFLLILTIVSTVGTSFSVMNLPEKLQDCYSRLSRSSSSYPIFSPASRQRYCIKQYLNRRNREDWLRESPVITGDNGFKTTDLTAYEPDINVNQIYWSPPLQEWRYPIINNFWQGKTQYWPAVQPSFNQFWKPSTKPSFPKTWNTNDFFKSHSKSGSSESQFPVTTTTIAPKTEALQMTTTAPIKWQKNQQFFNVQRNPVQRTRYWVAPMWSVVPNYLKVPRIPFNNKWRYPNWVLENPWNRINNAYDVPKYPIIPMETFSE